MFVCYHRRMQFIVLGLLSLAILSASGSTVLAEDPPSAVGPVLKLFKSGRLPPERQGTVVEMICSRGNEHDLRVVFDQLMMPAGFSPDLRLKVIGWLSEAAATRKVNPTGDLSKFTNLISAKETPVRLAAIRAEETAARKAAEHAAQLAQKEAGRLAEAERARLAAVRAEEKAAAERAAKEAARAAAFPSHNFRINASSCSQNPGRGRRSSRSAWSASRV